MPKLSANYLTVDPTGRVSATFPGGLDLTALGPPFTATPPVGQVRWHKDTSSGALVAGIMAAEDATAGSVQMTKYRRSNAHIGQAIMGVMDQANVYDSLVSASSGPNPIDKNVQVSAAGSNYLLARGDGATDFIKASATGDFKIFWTSTLLNFAGSTSTAPAVIGHNLGRTPTLWGGCALDGTFGGVTIAFLALSTTTVTIAGYRAFGAITGNVQFSVLVGG